MNKSKILLIVVGLLIIGFLSACSSTLSGPKITGTLTQTSTSVPSLTPEPTKTPTRTPTPKPTKYYIGTASGQYTQAQLAINGSKSAKDQKTRFENWGNNFWIKFDNRPFAPESTELFWKYIYDDPNNPKEVIVVVEAGGEYQNKLFTVPIKGGKFMEYPPKVKGDGIPEGFGPLEISAGGEGNWLSVENGNLVRKNDQGVVVEKLNMETATWEEVKQLTPEQIKLVEELRERWERNYKMSADSISITFEENGLVVYTDKITGRVIGSSESDTYLDPENTTGVDQLPDGSWVFNPELLERLAEEGLEKTDLKPSNDWRKAPDEKVRAYTLAIQKDVMDRIDQVVGVGPNEKYNIRDILLYSFPDGTYAWGMVLGKSPKGESWTGTKNKRFILYRTDKGEIKFLQVYYPNYLIYH